MDMSSTRTNDQFPLPHPGVFYGAYPSRSVKEKTYLESLLQRVKVLFHPANASSDKSCRSLLDKIDAMQSSAECMDDKVFDQWITDVKIKLRGRGLEDDLVVSVFALIREASRRSLGMQHYHCQLTAGWLMLQQKIAEMQTGEGKTLTATLPAASAAMAGMPVHVITVNDYLVKRDAQLMEPLYNRLGLSVGCIVEGMSEAERKAAYNCDINLLH